MKIYKSTIAACILSLSVSRAVSASAPAADLTVYAFSAGAADAFLLTTENSAVMIDCGEKKFGKEIAGFLEEKDIGALDYLIITHFDKDHVGGAAKVLSSVSVDQVLQSNYPKDSKSYEKYVEALEEAGMEAETVTEEMSFELDGVQYEIDPPLGGYKKDESNNSSLIVSVVNGEDDLLFMGDAEKERIAEFLADHDGSCEFLKVPHHGRIDDNSAELFETVKPEAAVITSSEEEPEDEDVIGWLEYFGSEVFLTKNGPVIIESTGNGIEAHYE